jgi:hypothetical protein
MDKKIGRKLAVVYPCKFQINGNSIMPRAFRISQSGGRLHLTVHKVGCDRDNLYVLFMCGLQVNLLI